MAKKPETSLPLSKLIPQYGKLKGQLTEIDKAAKLLNTRIKDIMIEQDLSEQEANGWIAKYSIRKTESFDEPNLLEFLKSHKEFKSCVKTKEYIDMDELENILYEQKIPKKLLLGMDKFRVVKETGYLTICKTKEK